MQIKNLKQYLWLFKTNFIISAFTFGGGYVVIPMIKKYFVTEKKQFSEQELINMASIAQSSPGAIAINLSVLAGYRTAGFTGSVISCIASVLPPFLILSVLSNYYQMVQDNLIIAAILKGMQAGVCAFMIEVVWDMGRALQKEKETFLSLCAFFTFFSVFLFHVPIYYLIFICILSNLCFSKLSNKKERFQI